MEEAFTYDRLDRLTGIIVNNDTTGVIAYDDYGRMTMKRIHGHMVFDSTSYGTDGRPHAISAARTYPYQPDLYMNYTSFDKLQRVEKNNLSLSYEYGYDHQRIRMFEVDGSDTILRKEYAGACEFVSVNGGLPSTLTYLSGPLGVFAVSDNRMQPSSKQMYYIHPDHLGSWTTVTAWNGTVVQDVWFDAWGTPYYSDSANLVQATSLFFDRGFTGHEHLVDFDLINMNGRVYDPFTSSFLSVDNYVQDPSYTQNFNRYAYCMNNPLKYTDPDGEWAHLVIGALVGGVGNLLSGLLSGKIDTFGEGLAYFGIGAVAGALSAGVGAGVSSLIGGGTFNAGFWGTTAAKTAVSSFASGSVIGASSGLTGGFVTGAGNSWMQGANLGQGLWAGIKAGGIGILGGAIGGGLAGGIDAILHGRDFLSGDVVIKNSRAYPSGPDYMQQPNSGDCAIKSGKVIYDYDNEIPISSSQIRQDLGLPCKGGVSDVDYWNAFGEQYGYDITQTSTLTENVASPSTAYGIGSFNDGAHVALSNSQNGTDITHTVLIRETETRFHTTWGKGAHVKMSYRFWVQNPTTGYRDPTSYSSISKAVNMFIIRKQ